MEASVKILALLLTIVCSSVNCDFTLGKTNWGTWGPMETCTGAAYVDGFRLKVEKDQGTFGDDSALNGIQFHCTDGKILSSYIGPFGEWKPWQYCPHGDVVTGVNFRSEHDRGAFTDDTAGNNLNLRCFGGIWLYGKGTSWGSWNEGYCANGGHVCGLQTQVEPDRGASDDTALNRITVKCCLFRPTTTQATTPTPTRRTTKLTTPKPTTTTNRPTTTRRFTTRKTA